MQFGINPISNTADNAEAHKDIQTKTKGTSQLSVTIPCGWATRVHLQAVGKKNRGQQVGGRLEKVYMPSVVLRTL